MAGSVAISQEKVPSDIILLTAFVQINNLFSVQELNIYFQTFCYQIMFQKLIEMFGKMNISLASHGSDEDAVYFWAAIGCLKLASKLHV